MTESINSEENGLFLAEKNELISEIKDLGEKYLTFHVGGKFLAAEINIISEIIEYGDVTRVPLTPPQVRGVINLRGNVVPIIDLAELLNLNVSATTKKTCFIIADIENAGERMDIGFVVDEVSDVINVHEDDIETAPQIGVDINSEFINGMGKVREGFVILLSLSEVLSVDGLSKIIYDVSLN